jgi:hypothetical protein
MSRGPIPARITLRARVSQPRHLAGLSPTITRGS